jgi:hypothetical protein
MSPEVVYQESGAALRPLWVTVGALGLGFLVDIGTGGGTAHLLGWLLAVLLVGGVVAVSCFARSRTETVWVTTGVLRVGQEVLPLSRVDADALATAEEVGGPQVGARILGGAMSLPRGRAPLPVRLTDGSTVVVPSRDPARLRVALREVLPARSD